MHHSRSRTASNVVGLFCPDVGAPEEKALSGTMLGGRTRRCCSVEGGISAVRLMREDLCASPMLTEESVPLCGTCAVRYDERRLEVGCVECGRALQAHLDLPDSMALLADAA